MSFWVLWWPPGWVVALLESFHHITCFLIRFSPSFICSDGSDGDSFLIQTSASAIIHSRAQSHSQNHLLNFAEVTTHGTCIARRCGTDWYILQKEEVMGYISCVRLHLSRDAKCFADIASDASVIYSIWVWFPFFTARSTNPLRNGFYSTKWN